MCIVEVNTLSDKTVIYSRQSGGEAVPVTVRIEWLPNGAIFPIAYWTPDGSCYEVKHLFECVPLAFLKDRSEGLRFEIRCELTETPEHDDEMLGASHDAYLYFTDNWFCGRNIIDARYGHSGKEFVSVTLDIFPNCDYELAYFTVKGMRYMVEKTVAAEPRGSFCAGGIGVRHQVKARLVNHDDDEAPDPMHSNRREAALFFEINKWFVVVKPS